MAITLALLGLPHRVIPVDRAAGEQRRPHFLAINPAAAVPAILDRDPGLPQPLALAQSGAILLYLAEKAGRLLPSSGAPRARALQWLMQALTDVNPAASLVFMGRHGLIPGMTAETQGFLDARLARFLRDAEAALDGQDFLVGDLSVADLALYPIVVHRWKDADIAARYPRLADWAARVAALPGVAAILPLP